MEYVETSQPPVETARRGRTPRDMALSLLVLLVPIFVLLAAYRFLGGESPTVVDQSSAYDTARAAGLFPVTMPSTLPTGWQPVRSAFSRGDAGAVLRAGFRTPDGGTAQLIESNVNADALVRGELGEDARIEDMVSLVGRDWQRYVTSSGERALVLRQPDRTVIVVGQASLEELATLAAAAS
jgi:Protein of unknown function (DUF4245)